jgi:hypothetical protein
VKEYPVSKPKTSSTPQWLWASSREGFLKSFMLLYKTSSPIFLKLVLCTALAAWNVLTYVLPELPKNSMIRQELKKTNAYTACAVMKSAGSMPLN